MPRYSKKRYYKKSKRYYYRRSKVSKLNKKVNYIMSKFDGEPKKVDNAI